MKYDSEHQLADLQVECSNKDRTIQELEKHIEDMKEEVQKLELQLDELHKKQTEVEEQHRKDIEIMVVKYFLTRSIILFLTNILLTTPASRLNCNKKF